jgi:hypothetical protein
MNTVKHSAHTRTLARALSTAGILSAVATVALLGAPTPAHAQDRTPSKSALRFDHFRDFETLVAQSKALAAAHPSLLTYVEVGSSTQGRPIFVLILNNAATGPDTEKPAMYIDGTIHGNEIQAAETVLYTVWYLVENHGRLSPITELVDRTAFYFIPCVNPDGHANWFAAINNPHTSRTGMKPTDNDLDGVADEDGPDDLDGDGSIGMMWRRDPNGTHRRSELDPNEMERVDPAPRADGTIRRGDWVLVGQEGLDNDGDGEINEDGPGGYDMNRNWPSDWHPRHVEGGAGDWPLSYPETEAVARFILSRPNIAAGQAYHNTGGMILRGPGAPANERAYAGDRGVYDAIANRGVEMLPGYRSLVIHSDLYPVRGGFVNWLSEGFGIVSYTNELWTDRRIMQNGSAPNDEQRRIWRDQLLFGETRTPLTEVAHPTLGTVLVGGPTKWSSRIPPSWMLEEECHRNAAFTIFHAQEMPRVSFGPTRVRAVAPRLFEVTVELRNDALIPTRTARAAETKAGIPDRVTITPPTGVTVTASGLADRRFDERYRPQEKGKPTIVRLERGVPSRGSTYVRFFVEGGAGAEVGVAFAAEKARDIATTVRLEATEP